MILIQQEGSIAPIKGHLGRHYLKTQKNYVL